ncbi:UNVERIFIED_CONTAM: hypothetical protein FKN15_004811 [Acipenser sinensis]
MPACGGSTRWGRSCGQYMISRSSRVLNEGPEWKVWQEQDRVFRYVKYWIRLGIPPQERIQKAVSRAVQRGIEELGLAAGQAAVDSSSGLEWEDRDLTFFSCRPRHWNIQSNLKGNTLTTLV